MPNSVNNVKTEYTFETKKAVAALSTLVSKLKGLKSELESTKRTSRETFSSETTKSLKTFGDAIQAEKGKIVQLRGASRELEAAFASLKKESESLKTAQDAVKQIQKTKVSPLSASLEQAKKDRQKIAGEMKQIYNELYDSFKDAPTSATKTSDADVKRLINSDAKYQEVVSKWWQSIGVFDELSDKLREAQTEEEAAKREAEGFAHAVGILQDRVANYTGGGLTDKDVSATLKTNNSLVNTAQSNIHNLTNAIREETSTAITGKNANKELAEEEKKSGNNAKSSASAHKSFASTLSKVSKTIKKIKSAISSVVGGFKNIASSIKSAIPGANKFGGALGKLASQFKRLFVMRILRNAISAMIKGFQEGIQNIAKYSAALNNLDANHANQTMSELASTALYLKNTLGSAAIPVLNAILPIIRAIATGFATAVNYVNQFISALGGKSSWTRAKQVTVDYASSLGDVGSSAGGAKDAVEDLKRTILGFDEINKLNDANSSSGSGGSGGGGGGSDTVNVEDMFEEVPIDNKVTKWLKDLKPYIDAIKDAWGDVKKAVKDLVESEGFKYLVGTAFDMVLKGIFTALETIATLIGNIKTALDDSEIQGKIWQVKKAWDEVRHAITNLTNSPAWQSVVTAITFVGLSTIEGLLSSISGLLEGLRKGIEDLDKNGKIDEFKEAWDKVSKAVSDLFNSEGFQDFESTVLYMAVTALSGILDTIGTIVRDVITPAFDELSQNGTFDEMARTWDEIWKSIKNISESRLFQEVLGTGLKLGLEGIGSALKVIADALQIIDGILTLDLEKTGTGFAKAILDIFDPIISTAATLVDKLNAFLGTPTNYAEDWGNVSGALRDAADKGTTFQTEYNQRINPQEAKGSTTNKSKSGATHGGGGGSFDQGKTDGKEYKNGYEKGSKGLTVPVDATTEDADEKYTEFKDEVSNTVMNAPVDARTTKAKEAARRLREEINRTTATVPVDANTNKANTKYNTYKSNTEKTLTSPVDANTSKATTAYSTWKGVVDKGTTAPVSAEMKTGASTLYGTISADWAKNVTGLGLKLPTGAEITTWGSTMYNDFNTDHWLPATANKALSTNAKITTTGDTLWGQAKAAWQESAGTLSVSAHVTNVTGMKTAVISELSGTHISIEQQNGQWVAMARASGGIINAASGSFVDSAQLFMARENGIPEYVGRFGSQSAVANNYQITEGIALGVQRATATQNELLREQNSLLREIASKSGNTSVSSILGAMNRVNKRTGTPVVQMG